MKKIKAIRYFCRFYKKYLDLEIESLKEKGITMVQFFIDVK